MRRWLIALVAVASFGLGWVANDIAAHTCVVTRQERGIYRQPEVQKVCQP